MKTAMWSGGVMAVAMGLGLVAGCSDAPDESAPDESSGQQEQAAVVAPDPAKELLITDVSVVEGNRFTTPKAGKKNTDPDGAWTIGRLLENQLPSAQRTPAGVSEFVFGWLRQWETDQTINGQVVPARPAIRTLLIDPWKTASGCATTAPDASCTLDMTKAPFRLLAIVNRPDLRDLPDGTDPGTGGEGRFVFGAIGPTGNAMQFTVIFEYKLPVKDAKETKAWAEKWHALGRHPFGARYNDELHKVVQEFMKVDAAGPGQSALSQIRINEVSLAPVGSDPSNLPSTKLWELREFVRSTDRVSGKVVLAGDTVKQEPSLALSGTAALGAWATANRAALLDGTYAVPATLDGQPILAASSLAPFDFVWDIPGVSTEVRQALALGTCNGCHTNETGTAFTHIKPRQPGVAAALSTFLADQEAVGGPRYTDFVDLLTNPVVKPGPAKDHKKPKKPKP
ncbi:MAG: hypothetical protein EOO74_01710 [Myxococcales bacterium]|nr:MAG: hypothetical protein EOO74_01710 [Myxococcales bacterium]